MTLEEARKSFHTTWGHPRKPPIFAIWNKCRSQEKGVKDCDELPFLLAMHNIYDERDSNQLWGAGRIELRQIVAARREKAHNIQKMHDADRAREIKEALRI
jgi:hypothetical protein